MLKAVFKLRDYLHAHPSYLVALGLAVAALGNLIAGRYDAATDAITAAASVLGLRALVSTPGAGDPHGPS